jgi:TetR/AcrR family transcriptional regulator
MKKTKKTKEKILEAGLKEFSSGGYAGARMERIAALAKVNKALLFYYFSSKENLYREVLKHAIRKVIPKVRNIVLLEQSPEGFLEKLPAVYIEFISRNQSFIKMIAFDFVQQTDLIKTTFEQAIGKGFRQGPRLILKKIEKWYQKGLITESDPLQFMINIISLCLFIFIARPIIEAIFNQKIGDEQFVRNRIKSVINILKQGMLK